MKAPKIRHILSILGVILLTSYIVFAIITFSPKDNNIICSDLVINFPGNDKNRLYTKDDISEILSNAGLHPLGESYKDVQTEKIEKKLRSNFLINYAECFKSPSGKVFLTLSQRTPKYLIAGNQSYFVDNNREIMPAILDHAVYVPVVSGYITSSMAEGSLFDFVSYLEENSFWDNQIEQIYVKKDLTVELIPRVGNTIIELGTLENFQKKLEKLKLLYSQAFTQIGWDRYEKIDLQYENQIVCSKSDRKPEPPKQVLIQKTDTIKKEL